MKGKGRWLLLALLLVAAGASAAVWRWTTGGALMWRTSSAARATGSGSLRVSLGPMRSIRPATSGVPASGPVSVRSASKVVTSSVPSL